MLDLIGESEFRRLTLVGVFAALTVYLFNLSESIDEGRIYIGFGAVSSLFLFSYLFTSTIGEIIVSGISLWWKREVKDEFSFIAKLILITFSMVLLLFSFIIWASFKFPLESLIFSILLGWVFGIWLFFKIILPLRQRLHIAALLSIVTICLIYYLLIYFLPARYLHPAVASMIQSVLGGVGGAAILTLFATPFAYLHDKKIKKKISNRW